MRISIAPSRGGKRRCDRGLLDNVLFMIQIDNDPKTQI